MLHLLHPALVHFAVAFLVVGGLVEACGLIGRKEEAARFGGRLVILGTVALVPVLATGYVAANTTVLTANGAGILAWHERNGWVLLGVFIAAQLYKGWNGGRVPERQRVAYSGLLLVGVVLTLVSAYLGGRLVYGEGIGVGL